MNKRHLVMVETCQGRYYFYRIEDYLKKNEGREELSSLLERFDITKVNPCFDSCFAEPERIELPEVVKGINTKNQ